MILVGILSLTAGLLVKINGRYAEMVETVNPFAFSFPDADGQIQTLSQWRGKILVLNFWATWCAPCLQEIPEFIKLQAEHQAQGLQFVGLAIDDAESVKNYQQTANVNYPLLIADQSGMQASKQLGNIIGAIPFTVIVNRDGKVAFRQMGEMTGDEVFAKLAPLLAK